jgi:hypothetical protein
LLVLRLQGMRHQGSTAAAGSGSASSVSEDLGHVLLRTPAAALKAAAQQGLLHYEREERELGR